MDMNFKIVENKEQIDLYTTFSNGTEHFVSSFPTVEAVNNFIQGLSKIKFQLPFKEVKKQKVTCSSELIEEYLEAIEDCTEDDEKYFPIKEDLKPIVDSMWRNSKHSDIDRGEDSFKFYIETKDKKVYEVDVYSIDIVRCEITYMEDFDFSIYKINK